MLSATHYVTECLRPSKESNISSIHRIAFSIRESQETNVKALFIINFSSSSCVWFRWHRAFASMASTRPHSSKWQLVVSERETLPQNRSETVNGGVSADCLMVSILCHHESANTALRFEITSLLFIASVIVEWYLLPIRHRHRHQTELRSEGKVHCFNDSAQSQIATLHRSVCRQIFRVICSVNADETTLEMSRSIDRSLYHNHQHPYPLSNDTKKQRVPSSSSFITNHRPIQCPVSSLDDSILRRAPFISSSTIPGDAPIQNTRPWIQTQHLMPATICILGDIPHSVSGSKTHKMSQKGVNEQT